MGVGGDDLDGEFGLGGVFGEEAGDESEGAFIAGSPGGGRVGGGCREVRAEGRVDLAGEGVGEDASGLMHLCRHFVDVTLRQSQFLGASCRLVPLHHVLRSLHGGPRRSDHGPHTQGLGLSLVLRFVRGMLLGPDPPQPGGVGFHLRISGGQAGRRVGFPIDRGRDPGHGRLRRFLGAQAIGERLARLIDREAAEANQGIEGVA